MIRRRRILHADKIIQNVIYVFCLLMFLQLKGLYSHKSNPILMYSTMNDIRVAILDSYDLTKSVQEVIIKDLAQSAAFDFLYRKNLVCWSDQVAELIQCITYNGTLTGEKIRVVSEDLITPNGIAIDWLTEKIYWTDGETNKIEVISIDKGHRKVLFWTDFDLVRAIVVVPEQGLMFWTDWGETPKIERAGMNGDQQTRRVIVSDDIIWPYGITVDYKNNLLYWMDVKIKFIDVIDFNGLNRKRITKDWLIHPYALTFFNDRLLWTDLKTMSIYAYDMQTSNKTVLNLNKTKAEHIQMDIAVKTEPIPMDITVMDESRQLIPEQYPCKVGNGGCSHLCLLSPNTPSGYSCACPTGVKLREASNTTCNDGPQAQLIVAQRSAIFKISLDTPDYTPFVLPLKDIKRAISVDYDPKSEFIYWADNTAKTISRARVDGSEQMTIIHTGAGIPESIAVDPIARNIYWTDPIADTISVSKLDGSSRKIIIHNELYAPRAIALHPTAGLMFWSDWKKPKIERANLDGSDRILLISERVMWPNGIALDVVNNKMYWGDAWTHKIEVCNIDGLERRELHSMEIVHIFGLTLLGEHLYWTDIHTRSLERINKKTGLERQPLIDQMANMMGVKAIRIGEQVGWNPCAENNGNCSHFCFNKPKDYVCGCPIGLELINDMRTCMEPEAFLVYSRKHIIGRLSVENENNDAVLPLKEVKDVSAIAVHVSGVKIYWSDSKTKTINRCSINGSNMEKILESTGAVEGIAVDWSGQNIYWTDAVTHRIEVSRLDGSSRRALVWQGIKKPKSIALDPKKGYMYWSELGSKTVKRAAMDGSNPTLVADQVGKVQSLAIDYDKRTIYWAALEPPAIEYSHLDGSDRKKLLGDNIQMPYALTIYMDHLFWGDWTTGNIEVVNKTDGSNRQKVHKNLDFISDLKVFHKSRHSGGNQCAVDNGGCSHLCLALPSVELREADYRCSCPTHYKLNKDNLTCSEPEEFILYAQKNSAGRIMITNGECNDATVPVSGLKNVKTIEYDAVSRLLYWMDEDSNSIRRIPISYSTTSVSEASVVVEDLSKPFHMVLDVLGRALYWTCLDKETINVTLIDNNSSVWVIVRDDKMMPRHLALHQTKRLLIWNDVGLGAIMRANVDGTSRMELAKVNNATALTVDQNTGHVYWAVARQIYAVDIDSANKRVVWQGGYASSMSAYSGALYWGGGDRVLTRVSLARRDAPAQPVAHIAKLTAIITVYKVARTHPCYKGGSCGRLPGACLAGGECGCGPHCVHETVCPRGHYRCLTQSQQTPCVLDDWRCDGHADCADGSDEGPVAGCDACVGGLRCADDACGATLGDCEAGALCVDRALPDAFRCDDRLCLAPRLLCDSRAHCEDGSDEAPTACRDNKVQHGSARALMWCGVAAAVACAAALAVAAFKRCSPAARARPVPHSAAIALYPAKHRDTPLGESATDGSESLSLCSRYPRPTLNPPPSPATASASSRRRAYRHYRAMNRPPPPTPASTDAGDSDCPPSPPPPSPTHTGER